MNTNRRNLILATVVFLLILTGIIIFFVLRSRANTCVGVECFTDTNNSEFSSINSTVLANSGLFSATDSLRMEYTFITPGISNVETFSNLKLLLLPKQTSRTDNGTIKVSIPSLLSYFDSSKAGWVYKFVWEDENPKSKLLDPEKFSAFLKDDNGAHFEAPRTCDSCSGFQSIASDLPLKGVFTITKSVIESCSQTGNSTLHYTIRIKNLGGASGFYDYIEDFLPSRFSTLKIFPSSINSGGVYSGGTIRWTGSEEERTLEKGTFKLLTYSVTIPSALISQFESSGIINTVNLVTNSKDSFAFTQRASLVCQKISDIPTPSVTSVITPTPVTNVIPATGLFDNSLFLGGITLIVLGILVYKFNIGTTLSSKLLAGISSPFLTFEKKIQKRKK